MINASLICQDRWHEHYLMVKIFFEISLTNGSCKLTIMSTDSNTSKSLGKIYFWNHILRHINKKCNTKYPVGSDFEYHLNASLMINENHVYQDRWWIHHLLMWIFVRISSH